MAASANATTTANLIIPEVIADYVETKLVDAIRLSPLARIDRTLQGNPGDEVTLPRYTYVGNALPVAEGEDIPISRLTQSQNKVKIHKIGRAIEFTDETILNAYNGDIASEAAKQILIAVNSGVEADLITNMRTNASLTINMTVGTDDPSEKVADGLTLFGEEVDGNGVVAVPPALLGEFRKSKNWIPNTELGAQQIVRGTFGSIYGYQVITMDRLKPHDEYAKTTDTSIDSSKTYYVANASGGFTAVVSPDVSEISTYYEKTSVGAKAFIIKPDALAIYMKRDTLVETDRDIIAEVNYIKASKLFASYLYDQSKLVMLNLS